MRQSLLWLLAHSLVPRFAKQRPLWLLAALASWLVTTPAGADVIPLEVVRITPSGAWYGGAVDPATGKFYERTSFDSDGVIRVYNDAASYAAGTFATVVAQTPRGFGMCFGAQDGKLFGRSTSGGWYGESPSLYTELRRWSGTTGATELILSAVPEMGGVNRTHTFDWGGFSGVNVLNDNGQLYILGTRLDQTGWLLVTLNPDLTVAASRTLNIPLTQGFAFIVKGKLFIGGTFQSSAIQRMVDIQTGAITSVSHSFSGPGTWYVTSAFYHEASDCLYLYNRGFGLYRVQQAAPKFGLGASPVANAGPDQSVNEGVAVTLSAVDSFDGNSPAWPLTYSWTQLSGVPVTLQNADSATASFIAPDVPPAGAVLTFQVTVSNGISEPASDTVTVTIGNVNFPPIAVAGTSQIVPEGMEVTLEGSGTDADGDALTLSWTQKSGPLVELNDADTATPWFVAPPVSYETGSVDLVFTLVVNDGHVNSGPSDVTVTVLNINAPPVANAGENQSVNELEPVTLNGTASADADGDALTYEWVQIGGAPIVALTGANTATASFIAPLLDLGGSAEGTTLTFRLTVSDGELSSTSNVNVRVSNVNHPPIADAGPDQTVPENTLITLDGSGSSDTDGDTLSYLWEQIDTGYPVILSDATAQSPQFTTPDIGVSGAVLRFKLTVDDGYGGIASSEVGINVTYANRPPIADAGGDGEAAEGSTVIVPGLGMDPDGNELEFRWIQVSGPAVNLSNAFSATVSFTAPAVTIAGDTVVLRLIVTDPFGGEAADDLAIAITNVNQAPLAIAPANLSVAEGGAVQLIGQGTDPDTEEQGELVYQWQQIAPTAEPPTAGHVLSFTAPVLNAGGSADVSLTLTFRLTVTDPSGASASSDVDVVVSNTRTAPIAVATGPSLVDEATAATLSGAGSSDPDGDALTYSWSQIAGPAVALHDAATANPYFMAPFVNADGAVLTFRLTVSDGFGGSSSDEVSVTTRNTNDAPIVDAARPSVASLWPPDHRMVPISILDVIDTNATVTITAVTQDEPTAGDTGGDVPIDAIISPDGSSVLLRAERSPQGDGRVYHIWFTAQDFEHTVTGVVRVCVPKTKKAPAVEGDLSVNSAK